MKVQAGNLLRNIAPAGPEEEATPLLETMAARVLRIVSHAHASPPGFWYDQPEAEWVLVVAGSAGLLVEGESAVRGLGPGDYVLIPPRVRHRVEWTAGDQPTVWLAIHLQEGSDSALHAMLGWP